MKICCFLLTLLVGSSCLLFRGTQGTTGVVCEPPPVPPNGSVKGSLLPFYGVGATVDFVCDYGFILQGYDVIQCTGGHHGGVPQWNRPFPTCIAIDCGNPGYLINGHVSIPDDGTRVGSRAQYHCDEGYDLVGTEFSTCEIDGKWRPALPQCKVRECPYLKSPPYGKVKTPSRTPGSTASYTCNEGFVLVGDDSRTCQNNGEWSGSSPACHIVDCGRVPDIEHGQIKYPEGTTLYRQVWYSCLTGYELIGSEFRSCSTNGQWVPPPPTCKPVPQINECPPLPTPYKGSVVATGYTPGSKATYTCVHGYVLVGPAEQVCQDNGQWSGSPPTCRPVDCGLLYPPLNGHVKFKSTTVGAYAVYTCNSGYTLVGLKDRRCEIDGRWSGIQPYCQPIDCGTPPDIKNGKVTLVDGNTKIGATATYVCVEGYSLYGEAEHTCLETGQWSEKLPECVIVDCGVLYAPSDGSIELSGTSVGDKAHYSCNTGFTLEGQERRECQANGKWSYSAPTCDAIRCKALHSPENGLVRHEGKTVGSQATYECFQGFVLKGNQYRTCHPGGYWSGYDPECIGVLCEPLENPPNGAVSTTGYHYGSKARYRCHPGYTLRGDDARKCLEDGYWSGHSPTCVFNGCHDLKDPLYGYIVISGREVGATATYHCSNGYVLDGKHGNRECRSNGEWSGHPPSCIPIPPVKCPYLSDPSNGKVQLSGTGVGAVARYSCNYDYRLDGSSELTCLGTGYWSASPPTCKRIFTCPTITHFKNGHVEVTGTSVGSTAYYTCNKGSNLVGEATRTCTEKGLWSGTDPWCHFPGCPNLDSPDNGYILLNRRTLGAYATYRCDKGYVIVGSDRRICQSDATWSGTPPICKRIECEELSDHPNGQVIITGTTIGSKATYVCNPKFTLVGESTRECHPNGEWSGKAPACEFIDCGTLSDPKNGRVVLSGTICGSTATYSCFDGYTLVGDAARQCLIDASWSGEAPVCTGNTCKALGNPLNGRVTVTGTSPDSKATYSCNKGYELIGSTTRICQGNGEWTEEEPVCERVVECEDLFNPANGIVDQRGNAPGATASYTCNFGYELFGQRVRTCLTNGEWSGREPSCTREEFDCGPLFNPENGAVDTSRGTTQGSVSTYSCIYGYEIKGVRRRTCTTSGWSDTEPSCEPVDCGQLPDPRFGRALVVSTVFGSVAIYDCYRGYVIVGEDRRTCQANGRWSGVAPTCASVDCGPLDNPVYGQVSVPSTAFNSLATYFCDSGFVLVGKLSRTCQDDGTWSGAAPICRRIEKFDCGPLRNPDNGAVDTSSGTTEGSVATYSCFIGYAIKGVKRRTCTSAGWSDTEPSCEPVDCGQLQRPQFGRVNIFSTIFGSIATYECSFGYVLVGEDRRTCQANGQWSGVPPTCAPVDCGDLLNPKYGEVTFTSTVFRSVATYVCDPTMVLFGSAQRQCQADGTWSGEPPTCEPKKLFDCGPLRNLDNGAVDTSSGTTEGSVATYSCFTGYKIKGDRRRTCTSNGWSDTEPSCEPVDCGELQGPRFGRVNHFSTIFGSVATYQCSFGYALVGKDRRTCQANGRWSGVAPTCAPVDCGRLGNPTYGRVSVLSTVLRSVATYYCNPAFALVGSARRQCQADGKWSGTAPTCIRKKFDCGSLRNPDNGAVDTSSGTTEESVATYSCFTGYKLKGVRRRTCTRRGWSDTEPSCKLIECGQLDNPENGVVGQSGSTVGSIATYSCINGYTLVGEEQRTCQPNGQWSNDAPICEKVKGTRTCGFPKAPRNGHVHTHCTYVGCYASYSCRQGYYLFGKRKIICQASGQWSHSPPTCKSNYYYYHH